MGGGWGDIVSRYPAGGLKGGGGGGVVTYIYDFPVQK